jgi:hypothetical protein
MSDSAAYRKPEPRLWPENYFTAEHVGWIDVQGISFRPAASKVMVAAR